MSYTRSDAVAVVAARLGNRTDQDDNIVADMQLAQQELEMGDVLPWFLLSGITTVQNNAGDLETIDVPSDFLMEVEEGGLWQYDSTADNPYTEVVKADWRDMRRADVSDYSTEATNYALVGSKIYLGPLIPTSQLTFKWMYYAQDTVLDTDVTNAWLTNAPEVLINETGIKRATALRDDKAVQAFNALLDRAYKRLWKTDEQRKHTLREYVMQYGQSGQTN